MAVLTNADREGLWAEFMQLASSEGQSLPLEKSDIRAAVNGLDDYVNTNAAAINSAIPQPARAALSTPQKALLLQFVVARRYLTGV